MKRQVSRSVAISIRTTQGTKGKLEELQRILSRKAGTQLTLTQTVEAAIDKMLDSFVSNPDQARLI